MRPAPREYLRQAGYDLLPIPSRGSGAILWLAHGATSNEFRGAGPPLWTNRWRRRKGSCSSWAAPPERGRLFEAGEARNGQTAHRNVSLLFNSCPGCDALIL